MKITFIHPPLDDPTIPYHSTAYLRGHLLQNGFENISTRDLNVEFVNYCLEDDVIHDLSDEVEHRLDALSLQGGLSFSEQEEFYSLWSAEKGDPGAIQQAAATMRSREAFTNYDVYRDSVKHLRRHFRTVGALCYPSEIQDFKMKSRGRYSIYHLNDLFNPDLCSKICYPIEKFFFDRCASDKDLLSSDCIGMSIVYDHQLLPGLHLLRLMKKRWPEKLFLLGGTATSQAYKYLKDKSLLKRFFDVCDGIVVGEGETAICEIADAGGDIQGNEKIPNLITYDSKSDTLRLPKSIHYENVAALGCPVYQHSWDLYLSPERGINYSPTRGCYWNRCTFCDYGLNTDKPTSPWREKTADAVVADLKKISKEENVTYVYFAVDVMAPGYLERLSDAIRESDLNIRWGAELRMEKIFSKDRCRKMAESGCVSVSFGMESGNQRVLDLIDKGTKVQYMGETMNNFADAGIAVQIMAFSHFPTETETERKETMGFVQLHKDSWSTGGIGKFVLTGTALVAKNPEKFGISLTEARDADIVRSLGYQSTVAGERQMLSAEEGDESFDETGGLFPQVLPRPWAGGTDSLHSMIYYQKFGRQFFKEHPVAMPARSRKPQTSDEVLDCAVTVEGRLATSAFEISKIFKARDQLREHVKNMKDSAIEATYKAYLEWQQGVAAIERDEKKSFWIIQNAKRFKIAELVYLVLVHATDRRVTLRELLDAVNPVHKEPLRETLMSLHGKGYVSFSPERVAHQEYETVLS
ncbi:MAG: radical SAM protein [Acidobacteriia bacterium]|nr:radical SAM protein [Terriglobia bacterium]